jgi:hypothetical protein
MLVDHIVTAQWRLRRALQAEAGAIALRAHDDESRRAAPDLARQRREWMFAADPFEAMEQSVAGLDDLINWLGEARAAVEAEGDLTEAVVQKLSGAFDRKPNRLVSSLKSLRRSQAAGDAPEEPGAGKRRRSAALAFLDEELHRIETKREKLDEQERSREAGAPGAARFAKYEVQG